MSLSPSLKMGISLKNTASGPTVNLLTYSQQLDNGLGWGVTDCTVSANSVLAPDGTTTAEMFTATNTGPCATHGNVTVTSGIAHTISVYVPAGGTALFAYIQVNANGGGSGAAFFTVNRSSGAVSANVDLVGGQSLSGITSVSDGAGGWRIYASFTAAHATQACIFGFSETTASRTSVIGKTCPLWQAQLVEGTVPGGIILRAA